MINFNFHNHALFWVSVVFSKGCTGWYFTVLLWLWGTSPLENVKSYHHYVVSRKLSRLWLGRQNGISHMSLSIHPLSYISHILLLLYQVKYILPVCAYTCLTAVCKVPWKIIPIDWKDRVPSFNGIWLLVINLLVPRDRYGKVIN